MVRSNRVRGLGGILRALKLAKPHSVVSIDCDGKETRVNLTGARGRYERGAKTLVALECVSFRCLDGDDAVGEVVYVEQPKEDDDREDDEKPDGKSKAVASEVAAIAKIVFEAQDKALSRQTDMVKQVTTAAVDLMTAAAEGMRHASERAGKLDNMLTTLMNRRERELADTARRLEEGLEDLAEQVEKKTDETAGDAADTALGELLSMVKMPKKPAATKAG